MPFEISVESDFLFARLYGVITAADLDKIASEVEVIEDSLPTSMNRITDITAVEQFEVGFPDVNILAERRRTRVFSQPVKCAIIVREPVQFGLARMFQMLSDNSQIEVRILYSATEAKDWFSSTPEMGTS